MILTRIDATYAVAGKFVSRITLFARTEGFCIQMERLLEFGWDVRKTQVDCSELAPLERAGLIGPIWPLVPLEEILALLRDPPGSPEAIYEPADTEAQP